ncbi:MAG: ATP-binding protein [Armatimonadota bacterium]|nr:ATP-binding protein [Armatimonadota bacterium]
MMSRIKWKLTATYLTVIFVSMTVVGLYLSYSMEKQTVAELHERLASHLGLAAELVAAYLTSHPNPSSVDLVCVDLAQKIRARVVVRDAESRVIGDSARSEDVVEPSQREEKRLGEAPCNLCHAEARMAPHREIETGEVIVRNRRVATIEISASSFGAKHKSGKTRRIILSGLVITTLIAAAMSHRLAGSIANPISKMNRMAKEIASGNLDQQVSIDSHDEVGQFAQSFNSMAQRLREMMDAIAKEKDKMAAILATMADGVVVTDESGKVALFNKASEQLFLVPAKEVIDRGIAETPLHSDVAAMVIETLETGNLVRRQIVVSKSPEVTLSAHSTQIRDAAGRKRGAVVALRDMTERLHHEKAQRDFVGNVSHELRTPITAVRVTAEALRSGAKDNPELLDKFLGSLVRESERLSQLIDDLLEIAKLDAANRVVRQTPASISDTAERAVAYVRPKAQQQNLKIGVDVPREMMGFVDQQQIEQVLTNLLDNAVKCTPPGGSINVTADGDGDWIAVSVADTGIGIPKNEIRRIFERFYRVDKARSRELGGTGLGLAIVKDIVASHGGSVTVRSELDKGSVFTFTVPRWNPEAQGSGDG